MDLLDLRSVNDMIFWVQKRSVNNVQEVFPESYKLVESIGQPIITALVDFASDDYSIAAESKRLVEDILPLVAKGVWKGAVVTFTDVKEQPKVVDSFGLKLSDLPIIFFSEPDSNVPYVYKGDHEENDIRIWITDIVKAKMSGQPVYESNPANSFLITGEERDTTLKPLMLKSACLVPESRKEFEKLMSSSANDLVVFVYSSAVEDEENKMILQTYGWLSSEMKARKATTLDFIAYDVNLYGYSDWL